MGKENSGFHVLLDIRAGHKDNVEYVKLLGNIPYTNIELALRRMFSSYGIPEDVKFTFDMELNTRELD